MYQYFGTNIGMLYPFFRNYQHHLSTNDLTRQTRQGNAWNHSFQQNCFKKNGFTPYMKCNYGGCRISIAKSENKQGELKELLGSVFVPTESRNFLRPHSDDLDASLVYGKEDKNSVKSI